MENEMGGVENRHEFLNEEMMRDLEVMEIELKLGEDEFEADLAEDLHVDPDRIEREMEIHANLYGWYAMLYRKSQRFLAKLEREYKRWKAQTDQNMRDADSNPAKDFSFRTEKDLKAKIRCRDEYAEWKDAIESARHQVNVLESVVDALEHRRSILLRIEERQREERQASTS